MVVLAADLVDVEEAGVDLAEDAVDQGEALAVDVVAVDGTRVVTVADGTRDGETKDGEIRDTTKLTPVTMVPMEVARDMVVVTAAARDMVADIHRAVTAPAADSVVDADADVAAGVDVADTRSSQTWSCPLPTSFSVSPLSAMHSTLSCRFTAPVYKQL